MESGAGPFVGYTPRLAVHSLDAGGMTMRGYRSLLVVGSVLCVLSTFKADTARAVPAFARREGVPCQMCHFRMPELNEDGHAYLRRGLREEREETEEASREVPNPAAEERPLGMPLELQWARYLSAMGHHMFNLNRGERPSFDAGELDLWVGGPLNPRVSGIANPAFRIEEGGAEVEQAYGQYITRWAPRFGSARLGQLLPFAILFNGGGPQMPLSEPVVLSTPGDTGTGWTPASLLRGLEVGFVSLPRWNVYVGAAEPQLEAEEDERGRTLRYATRQAHGADGGRIDLYASSEFLWGERGNSITVYGYLGKASLASGGVGRRFHRVGGFGNLYLPRTKIVAGYLAGEDDAADGRSLDNSGLFVRGEHLLNNRWALYGRYDWFRRDLATGSSQTLSGPMLGVTWWARTQVRLTLEGLLLSGTGAPQERSLLTELFWVF